MKRVQRGLIVLSLIVLFSNLYAEKFSCIKQLREHSVSSSLRGLARNVFNVMAAPYWFPVKLSQQLVVGKDKQIWVNRIEFKKDLGRTVIGYLIYGLVPGRFVLTINDFHEETDEDFFDLETDDLVVVVDGFDEADFLDSQRKLLLKIVTEEKRRAGLNVVYINPRNPLEFASMLKDIRNEKGPISRLDIYSHGLEAGAIQINEAWITNKESEVFFDFVAADLMRPQSIVRINSCLVGRNENFLKRFGKAIMPQGGHVFASKLITVPSGTAELTEYLTSSDMPPVVDRLQNYLTGNLLNFVWIAYLKITSRIEESIPTAWDPVKKLRIYPDESPAPSSD